MTKKKITQQDVANDACVSKSTVSLVLSNHPRIPENTRRRVLASVEKLGYVYNLKAASLRTNRSYTVALLITDITNPFYAELALGIESELAEANYVPILGNSGDRLTNQTKLLSTMQERDVDGIILVPAADSSSEMITSLAEKIPIVLVSRYIPGIELDYVGIDNEVGARRAMKYLIEHGHQRIAFVGGPEESTARRDRLMGYEGMLEKYKLPVDPAIQICSPVTRQGGVESITKLLTLSSPPTAVLCYNDVVAFGVMLGLRQAGLEPGIDMAVIGFDDVDEALLWKPTLTTIASQPEQMGNEAARLLLHRIENPDAETQQVIMPSRLIVRESSS